MSMSCMPAFSSSTWAISSRKDTSMNLTPCILVFRDLHSGMMMPGSAKVAEFGHTGSAVHWLERDGWYMSGTSQDIYFKRDGSILHECRIIS